MLTKFYKVYNHYRIWIITLLLLFFAVKSYSHVFDVELFSEHAAREEWERQEKQREIDNRRSKDQEKNRSISKEEYEKWRDEKDREQDREIEEWLSRKDKEREALSSRKEREERPGSGRGTTTPSNERHWRD